MFLDLHYIREQREGMLKKTPPNMTSCRKSASYVLVINDKQIDFDFLKWLDNLYRKPIQFHIKTMTIAQLPVLGILGKYCIVVSVFKIKIPEALLKSRC